MNLKGMSRRRACMCETNCGNEQIAFKTFLYFSLHGLTDLTALLLKYDVCPTDEIKCATYTLRCLWLIFFLITLQQISYAVRLQLFGVREKRRLSKMSNGTDRTASRTEETSDVRQAIFPGARHLLVFDETCGLRAVLPRHITRNGGILIAKRLSRFTFRGYRTPDHSDEVRIWHTHGWCRRTGKRLFWTDRGCSWTAARN